MQILMGVVGSVMTAAVLAACGWMARSISVISAKINASNDGTKYLLKDRITQSCRYHLRQGYIEPHEMECLLDMYKQYEALGGNSYIHAKVDEVMALPMEPLDIYKTKIGGTE